MSRSRTNSGAGELLVELRRDSSVPLHQQLESGIRDRIRQGLLRADAVMPVDPALATDLGLSRGVVVEAYQQLVAEGYLVSRAGGYTQVAPTAPGVEAPAHDRRRRPVGHRADSTSPTAGRTSRSSLAPPGCGRSPGDERGAEPELSPTSTAAALPSSAKRWPTTSTGSAVRRRGRRTC